MLQVFGRSRGVGSNARRSIHARREYTSQLRVKLSELLGSSAPSTWIKIDTDQYFLQDWGKVGVVSQKNAFESLLRGYAIRVERRSAFPDKRKQSLPARLQNIRQSLTCISVSRPNAELTSEYYGLMVQFVRQCAGMGLPDDTDDFHLQHGFEWWGVEEGFIEGFPLGHFDLGILEMKHALVRDYLNEHGAFDSPYIDAHQMSLRMFDHLGYLAIRQMYQNRGYTLV